MSTQMNRFKFVLMASVVGMGLLAARGASACVNDIDCTNNTACGGDICDWTKAPIACGPAGLAPKGMDGWCANDSQCKCFGLGARCVAPYCTFTLPSQAPGATGGAAGSTGGSSGSTGGASATTGGSSGNTGGATGSGGAKADGGTTTTKDDGGCAVAGVGAGSYSWLAAVGGLAALLASRRRRGRV